MKAVTVIDYGIGNLGSIKKALSALGAETVFSEDASEMSHASAIILPGVGAFASGMRGLEVRELTSAVKKFASSGRPMLGICLGAQLLLSKGFEFGEHEGLGIIPGRVEKFSGIKEKIPHIGWNKIYPPKGALWTDGVFKGFTESFDAYFVHSYVLKEDSEKDALGKTDYGGYEFTSVIRKGNVFGTQFHPEKSGENGLRIMKNFIELIS